MNPVVGVKGPNISEDDLTLVIPKCVAILTANDEAEFKWLIAQIVEATNRNAVRQLKDLLGDQAPELVDHLKQRLNVP